MENESILIQELSKLEMSELKKIAATWNLSKFSPKDKKTGVNLLYEAFQDEFLLLPN